MASTEFSRRRLGALALASFGTVGAVNALGVSSASAADRYNLGPRTLYRGVKNGYVRTLQTALNEVAGAGVAVDGRFGPGTDRAVRAFQSSKGLAADGRVGPAFKRALNGSAPAPAPAPAGDFYVPDNGHGTLAGGAGQNMKNRGSANPITNGTRLRYVLMAAERQGLGGIPRTSSMSLSKTAVQNTVKAFQRKNGLAADANIGPGTWAAAMRILGLGYSFNIDGYIAQTRDSAKGGDARARINAMNEYFAYFEGNTPYTWGGAGNGGDRAAGFDCSGLIFQMLAAGGVVVSSTNPVDHARRNFRSTQAIYNDPKLRTFDLSQRQDGDIITFASSSSRSGSSISHDGIFYGGKLIEAYAGGLVRTNWNGGNIRRDGYVRYVMPKVKRAFV